VARAQIGLEELERRRVFACRLKPERALETPDEAQEFLRDRGMLTLMPDCSLPSLFGACHEEPYKPGGRGFASWPKTKWWWAGELAARAGVHSVRIHAGKNLYLTDGTAALADPLCRAGLREAEEGCQGETAQQLVRHLADTGPAAVDELKEELDLDARELRGVRTRLERIGAVVARDLRIETAAGGHRHTSELYRWDQIFPVPFAVPGGLEELVVAGVEAAVLAPEREVRGWFSWPVPGEAVDKLVEAGRLERPGAGLLSAVETASGREPAGRSRSPRPA
jgi:hypothetical protein